MKNGDIEVAIVFAPVEDNISEIDSLDEKTTINADRHELGGLGSRAGAALMMLGFLVRAVGLIGPDVRGRRLKQALTRLFPGSICIEGLKATRWSWILRTPKRDISLTRRFPIVNHAATLIDVLSALRSCQLVVIGPALPEDLPWVKALVERLVADGKRRIFLVFSKEQMAAAKDQVLAIASIPRCLLLMNLTEATILCGTDKPKAALSILASNMVDAVITTQERIYVLTAHEGEFDVPARDMGCTAGRIGTGDIAVGIIAGLSAQLSLKAAVKLSTVAAALYARRGRVTSLAKLRKLAVTLPLRQMREPQFAGARRRFSLPAQAAATIAVAATIFGLWHRFLP